MRVVAQWKINRYVVVFEKKFYVIRVSCLCESLLLCSCCVCELRALTLIGEEEKRSIGREDRERKMPAWESNCQIDTLDYSLEVENAITLLWMTWLASRHPSEDCDLSMFVCMRSIVCVILVFVKWKVKLACFTFSFSFGENFLPD